MKPWALSAYWSANTVDHVGGVFDQAETLADRLQHAPGEQARQELANDPQQPGPPPSCWSLRTIRASIPALEQYSLSGVWRVLQRHQLGVRSARVRRCSPDPAYRLKEDTLLQCLLEVADAPEQRVLVFLDEMGYKRWPEDDATWGAEAPAARPEVMAVGTNTQWRIIGALNALTGRVDYLDNYIVGRRQVIGLYQRLDAVYPTAERIYVVQDNWSVHTHEDVQVALHALPRLVPIWLPSYAPWLNPIEKLWRWLRQDVLKLHRQANDWAGLRQQVRTFLDQFALGSHALLQYVGLAGTGKLAQAIYC